MACVALLISPSDHDLKLPLHRDEDGEILAIGRELQQCLTQVFNVVFFGVNVLKDMLGNLFTKLTLHLQLS